MGIASKKETEGKHQQQHAIHDTHRPGHHSHRAGSGRSCDAVWAQSTTHLQSFSINRGNFALLPFPPAHCYMVLRSNQLVRTELMDILSSNWMLSVAASRWGEVVVVHRLAYSVYSRANPCGHFLLAPHGPSRYGSSSILDGMVRVAFSCRYLMLLGGYISCW
jgi:hypothetical protein